MTRSNSSVKSTPLTDRVREWFALARLSVSDAGNYDFADLDRSFLQHNQTAQRYLGQDLDQCRVVEIGYGARPDRLIWFFGRGVDITGIDLDQPIVRGSLSEFLNVYRRNGWERAVKTVGRWYLNERARRSAMLATLSHRRGMPVTIPAERLIVGDAADALFWQQHRGAQYVFAEDVLEHIPEAALESVLARLAESMDPMGIAFLKPFVYTGISGGHHVEWYPHTLKAPRERRTEPWEHLRQNRHKANTYLNGITLAGYRVSFSRHFDILQETPVDPGMGRQFMTPELRAELREYSDEELFSNATIFVVRPRSRKTAPVPSASTIAG